MEEKKVIICIDRDGTLIHDENDHLFLGRDNDWQTRVQILPYVIDGLKFLRTIPGSAIYMITNQPGVAISDYPFLTMEKAHEVCTYVLKTLASMGARIDGYFLCPHATPDYVRKKPGVNFDEDLVHECKCLKPELGMVFDALKAENITPDNANVYVIGDRASDVQTAVNISGIGILIPFQNEPEEDQKVRKLAGQTRIHIAENLFGAAQLIVEKEQKRLP